MANTHRISASKSQSKHGMTDLRSTDKTWMADSGISLHDSSRTDSGFLSGGNLLSDQNLSSDDISSPVSQMSAPEFDQRIKENTYSRLDSGLCDVSLNDQLSCLSLDQDSCNNFNTSDFQKTSKSDLEECRKPQPWEIYFQQDEDGDTQLHIAIIQNFIEVAMSLIRLAPHPSLLDLRNKVAQSPLHLAVLTNQAPLVRWLVLHGADVNRVDRNGNTALHLACSAGYLNCVKALTAPIAVADLNTACVRHPNLTKQLPPDLDETNYDGETYVHLAAKGCHIDVLRHLAWFGANLNARDYKSGRTILHYAVESMNEKLLQFLLEETELVLDTPTYAGHSAYQLASALGSTAAPLLLARGAAAVQMEDDDDDDHPDHNASDSEDEEMTSVDVVRSGLGVYSRSAVPAQ